MSRKLVLIMGLVAYIMLLVLAVVFYEERLTMVDGALQFFDSIRKGTFHQFDRLGGNITHLFPIVASHLGLSLKAAAVSYSISFVVWDCFCFLFILLYYKNEKLALCVLLYSTVFVAHSFYWIVCEVKQGIPFTFLYLAAVERQLRSGKVSKGFIIFTPFALVLIVTYYPLLPLVMSFVFLYFWLHYDRKHTRLLIVLFVLYVILITIKISFFSSGYDEGSAGRALGIISYFPDYFSIPSNAVFIRRCIDDYFLLPVILAIVLVGLLINKRYAKLVLSLAYFFGLLLVLNVSYPDGGEQFYVESQYALLIVFLIIPLAYDVIPLIKKSALTAAGLSVILVLGIVKIYNTRKPYIERLNWYRHVLQETAELKNKKIIMDQSEVPMDMLKLSWASSYEFWLISTLETGNSRSIMISEHPGEFDQYQNETKGFIIKWWPPIPYSELKNKNYFNFSDTSAYQKY